MSKIIGVRFEKCDPISYYVTGAFEPEKGDRVIAETGMGVEMGTVILDDCDKEKLAAQQPIKAILRIADQQDIEREEANREKERSAFELCRDKIEQHGLEMKLIRVKYLFDNKKILFYFFSENRIDFRMLVKDLAAVFKTRIELRQIGVRDEARMVGGLGSCGRTLCCTSGLSDFQPVSIRMAKEQNLSLNPTSISGTCGRLMCCLSHENDTYEYLHSKLPDIGETVVKAGDKKVRGNVTAVNILAQTVKVMITGDGDDREIVELSVDEIVRNNRNENPERRERRSKHPVNKYQGNKARTPRNKGDMGVEPKGEERTKKKDI